MSEVFFYAYGNFITERQGGACRGAIVRYLRVGSGADCALCTHVGNVAAGAGANAKSVILGGRLLLVFTHGRRLAERASNGCVIRPAYLSFLFGNRRFFLVVENSHRPCSGRFGRRFVGNCSCQPEKSVILRAKKRKCFIKHLQFGKKCIIIIAIGGAPVGCAP